MHKIKILILATGLSCLSACQIISPIFVDYNGVRRDVAQWINQQQLMSMQQKRSLAQLSKAQQKIKRYPEYEQNQRLEVTRENHLYNQTNVPSALKRQKLQYFYKNN